MAFNIHEALRLEVNDVAVAGDQGDRAGILLRGDGTLHHLVDTLQALLGNTLRQVGGGGNGRGRRDQHRGKQHCRS